MGRKIFTIVLFAVMMFVAGVTAASADWFSLPSAEFISNAFSGFLPIVMSSDSAEVEGPVGALIVFSTKAKTNGDGGGRVGMNAMCAAEDPNAHFCTSTEVKNAADSTGVYFKSSTSEDSLIDDVGQENLNGDNCLGWSNNSSSLGGKILVRNAKWIQSINCGVTLPITCCKWVP